MRKLLLSLLLTPLLFADTSTLNSVAGGRVQTSHVNQYFNAFKQAVVPRNTSGAATNNGGSLGSSTFKWLRSFVSSGDWALGDVKIHHTFNGATFCGQGWMVADGRQITQANYDAEPGHTAGDWATFVTSSPLNNKFLPNMTNRYPVGSGTTTQDGSLAITAVGNASNQINLQHDHTHTHTAPSHMHAWLLDGLVGGYDTVFYNNAGTPTSQLVQIKSKNATFVGVQACVGPSSTCLGGVSSNNLVTAAPIYSVSSSTGNNTANPQLSTTQTIQPDSIQFQYCMRVVD